MAENKFNLENFVRAYLEFSSKEFWNGLTNRYLDNGWQDFDETRWKVPESVQPIVDVIKGAQDKPEANEYAKTIRFVTAVYSANSIATDESATKMLLNRIKQFQDQDLAYNALVKLKGMSGYNHPVYAKYSNSYQPLSEGIAKMLANNKNATADDIAELVYFCKTPQEAIQILNDVCAKVDENIDTEMKRDLPDVSKVGNLVDTPVYTMRVVATHMQMDEAAPEYIANVNSLDRQERMALNNQFMDMARLYKDKYNYNKIIESGDTEYIAKYQQGLEQQNATMVGQMHEQNAKLESDARVIADKDAQIQQLQNRIDSLERELEIARARIDQTQEDLRQSNRTVAKFKDATAKLEKAGMFERKKVIEDIVKISNEK